MYLTLELALLLLQLTASLGGEVRIDGKPPMDQTCHVELFRMGNKIADQYSTPSGNFRFERLEAGPHLINVRCAGLLETTARVDVMGNSGDTDVVVNLRSVNLRQPDKYLSKAQIYFRQQRWEDAIIIAHRGLRGDYRDAEIHLLLAKCYANLGDAASVERELRMFVNEAPNGEAKTKARAVLKLLGMKP
jgi:Flp pilus assembly protein TadD